MKKLPKIHFKIIPHKKMRYDTSGDYWFARKILQFRVSLLKCADYQFMVLIHELVEWYLCARKGVTPKMIDAFDFANQHLEGKQGDDKKAPYHNQHKFADKIERLLCKEMKLNWKKYDASFDDLEYK